MSKDKNNSQRKNNRSKKRIKQKKSHKGLFFYIKNFFRNLVYSDILADKRNRVVALYGVIIIALALIVRNTTKKNSYSVYINKNLVYAIPYSKELTKEELTEQVILKLKTVKGTNVKLNEEIEIKKEHTRKKDIAKDMNIAIKEISEKLTYKIEATEITVAGDLIGTVKNDDIANSILTKVKNSQSTEEEISKVEFVEEVLLKKKFVDESELDNEDDIYIMLTSDYETTNVYTIVSGDSLSLIALKNNVTIDDILSLNEGITRSTSLQIGRSLNIKSKIPILSLKIYEDVTTTEVIPFETEEKANPSEGTRYRVVIQKGKDGEGEVTERITKVNGVIENREVIETKITKEPIKEIIEVGTKNS